MYTGDEEMVTNVGGLSTEHMAAALVFGALGFLILVRRGFRGVAVNLGA